VASIATAAGHIQPNFTIVVPDPATLTPAQRATRNLPNCSITCQFTGAIHQVTLVLSLFT
jgi:hypothetical protein